MGINRVFNEKQTLGEATLTLWQELWVPLCGGAAVLGGWRTGRSLDIGTSSLLCFNGVKMIKW